MYGPDKRLSLLCECVDLAVEAADATAAAAGVVCDQEFFLDVWFLREEEKSLSSRALRSENAKDLLDPHLHLRRVDRALRDPDVPISEAVRRRP